MVPTPPPRPLRQILLPPSLGVMHGLASAFSITRKLLPAETVLGHGQIFLVMITLPTFAAFVASVQQTAGSHLLVPAVVLLLLSEVIVCFDVGVTLSPSATVQQLQRVDMKRSILQQLCLLAAMAAVYIYVSGDVKIMKFVNISELVTPISMLAAVVESISRSTLTRVVSTDLVLSGLCEQKNDAVQQDKTRRKEHEESLRELSEIFLGGDSTTSSVAVVPSQAPSQTVAPAEAPST